MGLTIAEQMALQDRRGGSNAEEVERLKLQVKRLQVERSFLWEKLQEAWQKLQEAHVAPCSSESAKS